MEMHRKYLPWYIIRGQLIKQINVKILINETFLFEIGFQLIF